MCPDNLHTLSCALVMTAIRLGHTINCRHAGCPIVTDGVKPKANGVWWERGRECQGNKHRDCLFIMPQSQLMRAIQSLQLWLSIGPSGICSTHTQSRHHTHTHTHFTFLHSDIPPDRGGHSREAKKRAKERKIQGWKGVIQWRSWMRDTACKKRTTWAEWEK